MAVEQPFWSHKYQVWIILPSLASEKMCGRAIEHMVVVVVVVMGIKRIQRDYISVDVNSNATRPV